MKLLKGFRVEKNLSFGRCLLMPKFRCPDCKEWFDLEIDEYDEGDYVNCPECNLELVVELKSGKPRLKIAREKDIDEEDEVGSFDEFYEE